MLWLTITQAWWFLFSPPPLGVNLSLSVEHPLWHLPFGCSVRCLLSNPWKSIGRHLLPDFHKLALLEFKRFCGWTLKLEAKVLWQKEVLESQRKEQFHQWHPRDLDTHKPQHLTFLTTPHFWRKFPQFSPNLKTFAKYLGFSFLLFLFFWTAFVLAFSLPFSSIINVECKKGKHRVYIVCLFVSHHQSDNITITFIWHFAAVLAALIS